MQACLENTALPSLESTPAWTLRVARPAADRNELAQELHGVPKAALRQVFGKALGTRLWQHHRATRSTIAKPGAAAVLPSTPIPDAEISSGMLRYLCAQAAARLRDHKRLAKSIVLTVQYSDGESETVREPLLQAENDAAALEAAARVALRNMRSNPFVSLKLDVTAMPAPCPLARAADCEETHLPFACVA